MTEPKNKQLYSKVKAEADEVFKKPSAYKSGWIVREYKKRGGKYLGSKKQDGLTRWFKEEWDDIGGKDYPVYRPTKRITKDTPLTASEIDPKQANPAFFVDAPSGNNPRSKMATLCLGCCFE